MYSAARAKDMFYNVNLDGNKNRKLNGKNNVELIFKDNKAFRLKIDNLNKKYQSMKIMTNYKALSKF